MISCEANPPKRTALLLEKPSESLRWRRWETKTIRIPALAAANLSNCHNVMGDFQRAREEANRAIEIRYWSLPAEHPDFIQSWLSCEGKGLNGLDDSDVAEDYLRRALELARQKLPRTADTSLSRRERSAKT